MNRITEPVSPVSESAAERREQVTAPTGQNDGVHPARRMIRGDDARIALAAAGDQRALESLLTTLLPRTRNLVRYLVPGDDDVDDFAQAALLEIVRALPGFEGRSALTTWADRIAVRETLRRVKRRRLRAAQQRELETQGIDGAAEASMADERYHAKRQVVALLDKLPEAQRNVLVLHYVMGMSVPEVAEALAVPFDTAKSRLRLATQRLRQLYGGKDD